MIVEIFKSAKAHKKYLENETVKSVWKKAEPLIVSRNISALKLTQCLSTQRYWS
jgi:quinol monooxygenase YgiN